MNRSDPALGIFGHTAPDLLAPRGYLNDEMATVARQHIELLQNPLASIPDEVPRAYLPSGKTEPGTATTMLLGGLVGVALGVGVAWLIDGAATLVLDFFNDVGGCLVVVLAAAVVAHVLSPLAVPLVAGFALSEAALRGRCRRPALGVRIGWVLAPAGVATTVWFAHRIVDSVPQWETVLNGMPESLWGLAIGVPTALVLAFIGAKGGLIFMALMGGLALLLLPMLGHQAGDDPYCERRGAFLRSSVIGRYPLEQLQPLLAALFTGSANAFGQIESIDIEEQPDAKVARLDLELLTGPDHETNLVELTAHYFEDGKTRRTRRLFSEPMTRDQVQVLAELVRAPLVDPFAEPDATGGEAAGA